MVQQYAQNERKVNPNDMVKVMANTYSFAQYWTKAFANDPSGSMPGPKEFSYATLFALPTCPACRRGDTARRRSEWRARRLSPYYWDMTNKTPSEAADQTHHFAAYFTAGYLYGNVEKAISVLTGDSPRENPGDLLLACQAANIGRLYRDDPKLDFQKAFKVLYEKPKKGSLPVQDLLWNAAIDFAFQYLPENKR